MYNSALIIEITKFFPVNLTLVRTGGSQNVPTTNSSSRKIALLPIFIHVEHPGLGTYTDVNGHSRWIMHVILRSTKAWVWLQCSKNVCDLFSRY